MSPNRFSIPRVDLPVDKMRPWLPIAGAAIGGLLLGLIIGWVIWPVEWKNAQLVDLTQAQKAAYLSAVADAYVMDGTQSPEVRLQERLTPLGEMTADEVVAAMAYLRELPEPDAVRLANLAQLASAVGIPVDASMMAAEGAGESTDALVAAIPEAETGGAPAEPAASAEPATATEDEGSGGAGIWTWLLAILASAALIGGGVFLLLRLSRPRQPSPSMVQPAAPVLPGEPRPVQPVLTTTSPPAEKAAQSKTTAWSPEKSPQPATAPIASGDDLEFDDEIEDDPASRYQRSTGTVIPMSDDEPQAPRYSATSMAGAPLAPPAPPAPADKPDWSPVAYASTGASGSAGSSAGGGVAVADAPVAVLAAPALAPTVSPAFAQTATIQPLPTTIPATVPATRPPARKFLTKFQCEYYAGAPDYIEAHSIVDPITNKFVGECGMSVSKRNRTLHDNAEEVIALEVWLYDKMDPKDNVNNTRVLLSQYAASRDLAQAFAQERDASKAIVVKPGTKFQVDGRNLVLEGEIVHVEYDREGVFRDVRLAMNILSRK